MLPQAPAVSFDELKRAARRYGEQTPFNESLASVLERITPGTDLAVPTDGRDPLEDLLDFLNKWGCRLPAGNREHRERLKDGLRAWWRQRPDDRLPPCHATLEDENLDVSGIAVVFDALATIEVLKARGRRRFGPVAASKTLYVLRPGVCLPWDTRIAEALGHRRRDGADYVAYLRDARALVNAILNGPDADRLLMLTNGDGPSAASLVNQFYFMEYTFSARK